MDEDSPALLTCKAESLADGRALKFRGVTAVNRPQSPGHKVGWLPQPQLVMWGAREALDTATNSGVSATDRARRQRALLPTLPKRPVNSAANVSGLPSCSLKISL